MKLCRMILGSHLWQCSAEPPCLELVGVMCVGSSLVGRARGARGSPWSDRSTCRVWRWDGQYGLSYTESEQESFVRSLRSRGPHYYHYNYYHYDYYQYDLDDTIIPRSSPLEMNWRLGEGTTLHVLRRALRCCGYSKILISCVLNAIIPSFGFFFFMLLKCSPDSVVCPTTRSESGPSPWPLTAWPREVDNHDQEKRGEGDDDNHEKSLPEQRSHTW